MSQIEVMEIAKSFADKKAVADLFIFRQQWEYFWPTRDQMERVKLRQSAC
jgi:hypothetical protein